LLGFQTGQQYSSLLLTIVLYNVSMIKGERSLNTLRTHDAMVLALCTVCSMWDDHERSLDKRTPRSLTVFVGVITWPCEV
jgi:hypothetical protein